MWVRISTYENPRGIEETWEFVKQNAIPRARDLPGYLGILGLTDRENGKTVSVTMWETEEAMLTNERVVEKLRSGFGEAAGLVVSTERYEVTVDELSRYHA